MLAIKDIVTRLYTLGKDLKDGLEELGRLCPELFALQAALNHVAMNMRFASTSKGPFSSALLGTDQFDSMMSATTALLEGMLHRLPKHDTGLTATLKQRLTWAWSKEDIKDYVVRRERLKPYFTRVTTTDNFDLSKHIYEEVHCIKEVQDQESLTRLRSDLKAWLGVYDCQALHEEALVAWQADTDKWFLQGHFARSSSWRGANFEDPQAASILWLRGKSGSGKTTMPSSAISDHATRSSEIHGPPYAFFYCTFKVLSTQDPNTILSSFIAQLCDQRPNLWSNLVEGYREAKKKKNTQHFQKPNLDELQGLL